MRVCLSLKLLGITFKSTFSQKYAQLAINLRALPHFTFKNIN